jgi:type II secretory pathway pseudopilin PulG
MKRHLLGYYFTVDFIVTVTVIAVVVAIIVSAVRESRKSMEVAAASAEVMGVYRMPFSTYYALNGEWPMSSEDLRDLLPARMANITLSMVANVRVTEGAITFDLLRQLSGKTLTLHPAVPAQDSLGPVKWVAGGKCLSPGWTMAGDDRTTVEDTYIARTLKQ